MIISHILFIFNCFFGNFSEKINQIDIGFVSFAQQPQVIALQAVTVIVAFCVIAYRFYKAFRYGV